MSGYDTPLFDFHYNSYDDDNNDDEDEWWDYRDITFLRPDLSEEGKSVQWCLDHDFFQVEEDYWSGDWYYETHPEEKILHQERLNRTNEIKELIENRRRRLHEKRNCPIRKAHEEMQDAAFFNMVQDDLARMRGVSREAIDKEVRSGQIPLFDFHNNSYDDDDEWWIHHNITFFRPDLSEEGKYVQWCLDHDFFQIREGYWSGDWYYETHPEEKILHQERLNRTDEIRELVENCKRRLHEKRNCPIRKAHEEMQDAALFNRLQDDLARMRGVSREAIDKEVRSGQIMSPISGPIQIQPPIPKRNQVAMANSKGVANKISDSKEANSMIKEDESSDEDDLGRKLAQDDRFWDGSWRADGFMGMFVRFDSEDYLEDQMAMFFEEQEDSSSPLQIEDAFLDILSGGDVETEVVRLHQGKLIPGKLHLASGVSHRIIMGICPPKVRIVKLDTEDMEMLLKNKALGNQSFSKGKFEEAMEHYEEALLSIVDNLFVAPTDQIKQVVNVLSNQAECHLRLNQDTEAGDAATSALLLDEGHDKSRIRRAKAELSIGGTAYLCQAEVDLEHVIEMQSSETSVESATSLLRRVKSKLKYEKKIFEQENTNKDWGWDLVMRSYKCRCW